MFEAGSAHSLSEVVTRLTEHPEDLMKQAAEAADWVRRERTWAGNGRAFDAVYTFAAQRYAERAR